MWLGRDRTRRRGMVCRTIRLWGGGRRKLAWRRSKIWRRLARMRARRRSQQAADISSPEPGCGACRDASHDRCRGRSPSGACRHACDEHPWPERDHAVLDVPTSCPWASGRTSDARHVAAAARHDATTLHHGATTVAGSTGRLRQLRGRRAGRCQAAGRAGTGGDRHLRSPWDVVNAGGVA